MVETNHSDLKRLVHDFRNESGIYYRQFVIWLGAGSAGAGTVFISLAARLPNPDYAFHVFLPSLSAFTVGVLSASFSVLFLSFSKSWAAEHFAAFHNREECSQAASKLPEIISSPPRIANEANRDKNRLVDGSRKAHEISEHAWKRHVFWKKLNNGAVIVSAAAFVCGLAWLIGFIGFGGSLIK